MNRRAVVQLRRYGRSVLILILLMIVGVAAGFYILLQQRLPDPFTTFYRVNAAFTTAAGVVPGLGEPVDVAGVHVGEILSTKLANGQGIIEMEIDPSKGVRHLFRNASAALTPNTPLDDMYVDIDPGTRSAGILPAGGTIPISETTTPTQSDELLDELDVDTRDWLTSLITELTGATQGRGEDLRRLLLNLQPTAQQTEVIGNLLAQRRTEITTLVHNLRQLTQATARSDGQLASSIEGGDTTFAALARQDTQLRAAIAELPGTLATTRSTLVGLTGFADQLVPTSRALIPIVHRLPTTLRQTRTLVNAATVLPVGKIRAFEAQALPLATQLGPISSVLKTTTPELDDSFRILHYVTNELAYDPGNGNPGFLYWLGWFAHNVDSFIGNSDANGPSWRLLLLTSCSSLGTFGSEGAALKTILQISCPSTSTTSLGGLAHTRSGR